MSKVFIGIDPGLTGAVAFLGEDGDFLLWDTVTILKGSGSVKSEVNASALYQHLMKVSQQTAVAVLERVNSMPGQAASSTFSLGDSFGTARACLACAGIPTTYVTPQTWKKHFKLTSDKEEARALAIKLYPTAELHLKKHVDRAEALLMATYCKQITEK